MKITFKRRRYSRCGVSKCAERGIWRENQRTHLCDTHAEIPSYAPVRAMVPDVDYAVGPDAKPPNRLVALWRAFWSADFGVYDTRDSRYWGGR